MEKLQTPKIFWIIDIEADLDFTVSHVGQKHFVFWQLPLSLHCILVGNFYSWNSEEQMSCFENGWTEPDMIEPK